jgi:adenosylcobinamide-phosphate synthase
MQALLAPLALIVERVFGYPRGLLDAIGHPVIWMGRLIAWLEVRLNHPTDRAEIRRNGGIAMVLALIGATLLCCLALLEVTRRLPLGWIVEALLASTLLAQKELGRAVSAVAGARSLVEGRAAVSHIVGRDPETLDEAGVCGAAIESLAESSSDAVVAPLFWLLLLGLPGIAIYKAINTADSMVGHRGERHRDFGWASARIDDLANWVPARLTALLLAGAALFLPGADAERAWTTALRDGPKHDSPNAGWPEAAMAGALGLSLGGPRTYDGEVHDLPRFGDGRRDLTPSDIRAALMLYERLLNVVLTLAIVVALAQWRAFG